MNIHANRVLRIIEDISYIRILDDTNGSDVLDHSETFEDVALEYFLARIEGAWNSADLKRLRSLVSEFCSFVQQRCNERSTRVILSIKSALVFVSQDFPSLADTLLYSPLMDSLDKRIDSWAEHGPPIDFYTNYLSAVKTRDRSPNLASHEWWKLLDNVKYVGDEITPIAEYYHQHRERSEFETRQITEKREFLAQMKLLIQEREQEAPDRQHINIADMPAWKRLHELWDKLHKNYLRIILARRKCAEKIVLLKSDMFDYEKVKDVNSISKKEKFRLRSLYVKSLKEAEHCTEELNKLISGFDKTLDTMNVIC